jgi:hypothetical protein
MNMGQHILGTLTRKYARTSWNNQQKSGEVVLFYQQE